MDLALSEYREKLISKILSATSSYQISRYIETAFRTLLARKLNGYIVERFMEKLTAELRKKLKEAGVKSSTDNICYAIQILEPVKPDERSVRKRDHELPGNI